MFVINRFFNRDFDNLGLCDRDVCSGLDSSCIP
jgi:hypothetical protein